MLNNKKIERIAASLNNPPYDNFELLLHTIEDLNKLNGWEPTQEDLDSKWFIPAKLALLHSEVSEALEGYRNNDSENLKEEIADILIRTFDLCNNLGIADIEKEIWKKVNKNYSRGMKHGSKKI